MPCPSDRLIRIGVWIAIAFLATGTHLLAQSSTPSVAENENRYNALILKYANTHRIHPMFVKAVIWRESNFQRNAIGKAGEIGLMQITEGAAIDWAKEHRCRVPTRSEMFDPDTNLTIGVWYLARARNYWSWHPYHHFLALCEYNAGRTGMRSLVSFSGNRQVAISSEHLRNYVSTIASRYELYLQNEPGASRVARNP
jgi:soluble lytic murein transglycosylase